MADAVSPACQEQLNAWCNTNINCPLLDSLGPLKAMYSGAHNPAAPFAWRCYAISSLNDLDEYRQGRDYCTRHKHLQEILQKCEDREAAMHQVRVDATGKAVQSDPVPAHDALPSSPPPLPPGALPRWTTSVEVTLPAIDTRDWRPSDGNELVKVHSWEVECIDSMEKHHLRNRTGNVSRKKAFLTREGLQCHGKCVRGVVDGFATHEEIAQMLPMAPVPGKGQSSSIKSWRWDQGLNADRSVPAVFHVLVARAQTVLDEQFGIRNLRFCE